MLLLACVRKSDVLGIDHDISSVNFDPKTTFTFDNSPRLPFRYAEAFLFVMLPYGAFHQVNYVSHFKLKAVSLLASSNADLCRSSLRFAIHVKYSQELLSQAFLQLS